jgi:Aspartyl/Asparaginyl beta-hydroxylase
MIKKTGFSVDQNLLKTAIDLLPNIDHKLSLNKPTGRFFYDPWKIKADFEDSVWNSILDSLPFDKGEARLIRLSPETCYPIHSDIDDRWHLSLTGENCYLIDLDNSIMHQTNLSGQWYEMDTSIRHSAVNFGPIDRIQLVIRKLLKDLDLEDYYVVEIKFKGIPKGRFFFDNILSPYLNLACKKTIISNVEHDLNELKMRFRIKKENFKEFKDLVDKTPLELNIL